jgi:chromosome segregation ATPase
MTQEYLLTAVQEHQKTISDMRVCIAFQQDQIDGLRRQLEEQNKIIKEYNRARKNMNEVESTCNELDEEQDRILARVERIENHMGIGSESEQTEDASFSTPPTSVIHSEQE